MLIALSKKIPVLGHFVTRPRLGLALVLGSLLWFALPQDWRTTTRILVSWDFAMALYLALAVIMMAGSDRQTIRNHAAALDNGQLLILFFTVTTAIASIAAIFAELAAAKADGGASQWFNIALAGLTVLLSWAFMHTMFALHYAHEYYDENDEDTARGLDFPGECDDPDYWDFVYFSFILGTAAQTADVAITSRKIRRVVTLHCAVAFLFNTTILALTVNIGASLAS